MAARPLLSTEWKPIPQSKLTWLGGGHQLDQPVVAPERVFEGFERDVVEVGARMGSRILFWGHCRMLIKPCTCPGWIQVYQTGLDRPAARRASGQPATDREGTAAQTGLAQPWSPGPPANTCQPRPWHLLCSFNVPMAGTKLGCQR